jgi:hypothetical protein
VLSSFWPAPTWLRAPHSGPTPIYRSEYREAYCRCTSSGSGPEHQPRRHATRINQTGVLQAHVATLRAWLNGSPHRLTTRHLSHPAPGGPFG